ncbi:transthyretin-like family domain-containing protein [Ditylenchus destructor]|nr:transthyretin-like family domain-containing protein [Ditylenchus destructor]
MPLIHDCLKKNYILVLLVLFCIEYGALSMRQQAVGARGRLRCGNTPAANVRIKLVDKDTGIDPDDELDATYTDSNGIFEVKGDTRELTNIDPQLKIYHDCNKGINPCPIKWVINIPDKYISSGTKPKKLFYLGDVNLEVEGDICQ